MLAPFAVERALGAVKMFERLNDPTMYGDIYSFLVMLGGRVRRAEQRDRGHYRGGFAYPFTPPGCTHIIYRYSPFSIQTWDYQV